MTEEKETVKKQKFNRFKAIRIGAIILVIITWLILIGLNISSDVSLKYPLIISVIISILGLIGYFAETISKNIKKKEEKNINKEPITEEEAKQIVQKTVEEMWDYVKIPNGFKSTESQTIANDLIYSFEVDLLYGKPQYIIINANEPEIIPTVIPVKKTKIQDKDKLINRKSRKPQNEDVEISEEGVDRFGRPTRKVQRRIQREKKEEKEEGVI